MRKGLCVLLLAIFTLTGCWDRIEVNDIAIVTLIGVDRAEQGLRLTVSVVAPSLAIPQAERGGGGAGEADLLFAAEGETVMDAMMKIQEKVSRRLFWGHARALIFGADYARDGVGPAVDFWSRHREPRLRMQVVVTPGQAGDFLRAQPGLERLLSEGVREVLNMHTQAVVLLRGFLAALRNPGQHPIAPRMAVVAGASGGPQGEVEVSGTAIFRDDKLIGWLDNAETRGLLWLRDEIQTGVVTMPVPVGGKVALQLIRGRTRVETRFDQGELRLVVTMVTEDDIFESSAPLDFGKSEIVLIMEELLEKDLRERIQPVLDKVQHQFGVDVLKFADAVRRGAPRLWEEELKERWDEEFPRVPVDLVIEAKVRRTGMHGAPMGVKSKEAKAKTEELIEQKGGAQ